MKGKESGISVAGLVMMALGTVIGGSFFLGSAIAIKNAGPSILVAFILGGILVYFILYALSEMTVADPAPGSFRTFAQRSFGEGAGFITGWVYWTGMILAMSSEATAASLLVSAWLPGISLPLLGALIIVLVTLANLLGANYLSKLESGLAAIKLFAILGFIIVAFALVSGLVTGIPAQGLGALKSESLIPGGIGGIAGSMLIVMFTYAGFEIIGLAAPEAVNPHRSVPRAITYTVLSLVALYTTAIALILPLISTSSMTEDISPMVSALTAHGLNWAATSIHIILVTAILSSMLAATFGLARMLRSLADDGHAPAFVKGRGEIPYRCILTSGAAMLLGLGMAFVLPKRIYIFLVSSGGFALLFTYLIILLTHYKLRKKNGCPPEGKCQLPGFPYTSWTAMIALIAIIASMPLVPGQGTGLIVGLILVAFYTLCYCLIKRRRSW